MSTSDRSSAPEQEQPSHPTIPPSWMGRRLLAPLDGSRLAEAVLPIAVRLATLFDAVIVLLHVIEKDAPARVHGEHHLANRAEAEAYLAQIAARLAGELGGGGARVEIHVHEAPVGNVAESLARHAEEQHADLIILSTHGEGGVHDVIWGSIAQQVLQLCNRPILLVQARPSVATTPFAPHSIMVPLDASAAAEAALPIAMTLARAMNAQLRLVMVVATPETVVGQQFTTKILLPGATRALLDVQEQQAAVYLEQLAESIRPSGVPVVAEVRRGDAVAQLASDTAEHADGLVVAATHGRAGLQAIWVPRVASRLLKRTRAPIMLVPIIEPDNFTANE
jgi:nucleotide-binding universal stress UspA family protein